jgi:hypothetical protein
MEERERCYSFVLSRTPHETYRFSLVEIRGKVGEIHPLLWPRQVPTSRRLPHCVAYYSVFGQDLRGNVSSSMTTSPMDITRAFLVVLLGEMVGSYPVTHRRQKWSVKQTFSTFLTRPNAVIFLLLYIHTAHALSLGGNRGISNIPPRHPRFTKIS